MEGSGVRGCSVEMSGRWVMCREETRIKASAIASPCGLDLMHDNGDEKNVDCFSSLSYNQSINRSKSINIISQLRFYSFWPCILPPSTQALLSLPFIVIAFSCPECHPHQIHMLKP